MPTPTDVTRCPLAGPTNPRHPHDCCSVSRHNYTKPDYILCASRSVREPAGAELLHHPGCVASGKQSSRTALSWYC
jgi:hypothetical protein